MKHVFYSNKSYMEMFETIIKYFDEKLSKEENLIAFSYNENDAT